jgi:hypothetical protein
MFIIMLLFVVTAYSGVVVYNETNKNMENKNKYNYSTWLQADMGKELSTIILFVFLFLTILSLCKDYYSSDKEYKRVEMLYNADNRIKTYLEENNFISIGYSENISLNFDLFDYYLLNNYVEKEVGIEFLLEKHNVENEIQLYKALKVVVTSIDDYDLNVFYRFKMDEDVKKLFNNSNSISEYEMEILNKKKGNLNTHNKELYKLRTIYVKDYSDKLVMLEKEFLENKSKIRIKKEEIIIKEFYLLLNNIYGDFKTKEIESSDLGEFTELLYSFQEDKFESMELEHLNDERMILLLRLIKKDDFISEGEFDILEGLISIIDTEKYQQKEANEFVQKYAQLAIEREYTNYKDIINEIKDNGFVRNIFESKLKEIYEENAVGFDGGYAYNIFKDYDEKLIKIEKSKAPIKKDSDLAIFLKRNMTKENSNYFKEIEAEIEKHGFIREKNSYKFGQLVEKYFEDRFKGYVDYLYIYQLVDKTSMKNLSNISNYKEKYKDNEVLRKILILINEDDLVSIAEYEVLENVVDKIRMDIYLQSKANNYTQEAARFAIQNNFENMVEIEQEILKNDHIRVVFKDRLEEIYENHLDISLSMFDAFEEMFKEVSEYSINSLKKFYLKGCEPAIIVYNEQLKIYGKTTQHVKNKVERKYMKACYKG